MIDILTGILVFLVVGIVLTNGGKGKTVQPVKKPVSKRKGGH